MTRRRYGAELLHAATDRKVLARHLATHVALRSGMGIDGLTRSGLDRMDAGSRGRMCEEVSNGLRSGTYRFSSYREVLVIKNSSSPPRSFSIPTVRDSLALKVLAEIIAEATSIRGPELPQAVVAKVKGVTLSDPDQEVVRVDVKNFFPSIDHKLLEVRLRRQIRYAPTLNAIIKAVRNGSVPLGARRTGLVRSEGIPLGVGISSPLAELYMSDLDNRFASRPDIHYFRFVDDILVLCPRGRSGAVLKELERALDDIGLCPHPVDAEGKTHVGPLEEAFVYLGYRFERGKVAVGPPGIRRMESSIARAFAQFRNSVRSARGEGPPTRSDESRRDAAERRLKWNLDLLVTGCIFEGQHRGWMKFYSQTDDMTQLNHLDSLIARKAATAGVSGAISIKRFVRTWHLIDSHSLGHGYIPDLDCYSVDAMRGHLVSIGGWDQADAENLAESDLRRVFNRRIRREVARLERDVVGKLS